MMPRTNHRATLPAAPSAIRHSSTVLEVSNLTLGFGGVQALSNISLAVASNALQAVIGPNGAGKTSLFNCLTGFYRPSSGSIIYRGREITRLSPPVIAALGVRRTFQNIRVFPRISVMENVLAGGHVSAVGSLHAVLFGTRRFRRSEARLREQAAGWLEFVGLGAEASRPAGELAYGMRKRMEIARAMMGNPGLLLLDEPAAGVSSVERGALAELISRLHADGVCVIMIEHDVELVMGLATNVCVLDHGRLLAAGRPEAVRSDPEVIRAYMGRRQQ